MPDRSHFVFLSILSYPFSSLFRPLSLSPSLPPPVSLSLHFSLTLSHSLSLSLPPSVLHSRTLFVCVSPCAPPPPPPFIFPLSRAHAFSLTLSHSRFCALALSLSLSFALSPSRALALALSLCLSLALALFLYRSCPLSRVLCALSLALSHVRARALSRMRTCSLIILSLFVSCCLFLSLGIFFPLSVCICVLLSLLLSRSCSLALVLSLSLFCQRSLSAYSFLLHNLALLACFLSQSCAVFSFDFSLPSIFILFYISFCYARILIRTALSLYVPSSTPHTVLFPKLAFDHSQATHKLELTSGFF